MNAEAALDEAIRRLVAVFDRLEDPYLRERGADLSCRDPRPHARHPDARACYGGHSENIGE